MENALEHRYWISRFWGVSNPQIYFSSLGSIHGWGFDCVIIVFRLAVPSPSLENLSLGPDISPNEEASLGTGVSDERFGRVERRVDGNSVGARVLGSRTLDI
jgi:hypothetical protein